MQDSGKWWGCFHLYREREKSHNSGTGSHDLHNEHGKDTYKEARLRWQKNHIGFYSKTPGTSLEDSDVPKYNRMYFSQSQNQCNIWLSYLHLEHGILFLKSYQGFVYVSTCMQPEGSKKDFLYMGINCPTIQSFCNLNIFILIISILYNIWQS